MEWLDAIVNGILLGGLYSLFGLGLALVFGVLRLVNVAHGEFIVLSAMVGVFLSTLFPGIHPLLLTVPVAAIAFATGYLLQAVLINRVATDTDLMVPMLFTFGLSVLLRNAMVEMLGADPRGLDGGALVASSVNFGSMQVGVFPVLVFVISVSLFLSVSWLVKSTEFGRIVRATADNPDIVRIMGVRPQRVFNMIMGLSLALAAVAGVMLAIRTNFTPFSGVDRLLLSFEIVIIGGLGSLTGALAGGIILGVAQIIGLKLFPESGPLFAHIVFLLILFAMPTGIFGRRG